MEHHAPHPNAAFEGYYNKFALPSGAHLVIVVCEVRNAPTNPRALSFVYVPKDASKIYHRDVFPDQLEMKRLDTANNSFVLDIPGIGCIRWNADDTTEYELKHDLFTFNATTTSRVPWSESTSTPEGILVNLPLPLHWHVQSLASPCKFSMSIPDYNLPREDTSGNATVHQEKNWAFSFPSAHMWVQCREGDRGFCCAGGQILGMEAFLLGYRSKDFDFDLRPPFAVRFAGLSPFLSYKVDWENRSFELSAQSFRRKITVNAVAPKGSFFPLSPPFPEGHRTNFLNQSFQATVVVKIYESGWLSPWRLIREETFEWASLEFGGDYYPLAGTENKFN
jgi:tocopherol cyclase